MPLGTEVGLGPGHIVLDAEPVPPSPKKGKPPNFRPMLLWRNSPFPKKGQSPPQILGPCYCGNPRPILGPCLLWPNGWMDQDATWYGGRPRRRPHCVRWGPSSPPHRKGHSSPPTFRRMSKPVSVVQGACFLRRSLL